MVHSMLLKETICRQCGGEALMRVSSSPFVLKHKKEQEKEKPGKFIKEFISETREAIEEEKKDMQKDFKC